MVVLRKEWTAATAKFLKDESSQRTNSTESDTAAEQLRDFLQGIDESAACDVVTQLKAPVNCLHKMVLNGTVDDMSHVVYDFYQKMYHRFNEHRFYKGLNPYDVHLLNTLVQSYLMTLTYAAVFESVLTEGEEEDLAMYQRIRAHSWMTAHHLELDIDEENPSVRKAIDLAKMEMKKIGKKESPDAKLECVVRCSRYLCQSLRVGTMGRGLVLAEELLPAMVWLLLRVNPPFIYSNIKYITWFGTPTQVLNGEAAYYFTQLCSAVSFIKTLTELSPYGPFDERDDLR